MQIHEDSILFSPTCELGFKVDFLLQKYHRFHYIQFLGANSRMSYALGVEFNLTTLLKSFLFKDCCGAVLKAPSLFPLPSLGSQGVVILPSRNSSSGFLDLALAPFIIYPLTALSLLFSFPSLFASPSLSPYFHPSSFSSCFTSLL